MGFDKRENARRYVPQDGDTLHSIAERETAAGNEISWQDIARFNWGTDDEYEANVYLRDELGAHRRDEENRFVIGANDTRRGELLIPVRFRRSGIALDQSHTLTVRRRTSRPQFLRCASVPGVTFAFDKSFLRPSVAGYLDGLEAGVREFPEAKILIFGHADFVGEVSYNKGLSERRARSIYAFITNDTDAWEALYNEESWGISAVQSILKTFGGPYDPGPVDGVNGDRTKAAVRRYQEDRGLSIDGVAGRDTRRELFREYMTSTYDIHLSPDQFMDPKHMGCSEYNLLTPEDEVRAEAAALEEQYATRSIGLVQEILAEMGPPFDPGPATGAENPETERAIRRYQQARRLSVNGTADRPTRDRLFLEKANEYNRRVTFYLFHRDRLPVLPCRHGDTGPCEIQRTPPSPRYIESFSCSFYDSIARNCVCEGGGLPATPTPAVRVHLRLRFRDPADQEHDFPREFPVRVVTPRTTHDTAVGENGGLVFDVERGDGSFSLRFPLDEPRYLASAPEGYSGSDPAERLATETEVTDLIANGWRVLKLPHPATGDHSWGTTESDWTASGASNYRDGSFQDLQDTSVNVGSDSSPVVLVLNPHWQYLKFVYFDRLLRNTLSILPITLEGFLRASDTANGPDTRSNWRVQSPHACQCLPWILQRPDPKPDRDVLVQFSTDPDTYIESRDNGARTMVSGTPRNAASTQRLAYYDLPRPWKSRHYYGRLLARGGGNRAAQQGPFEDMAAVATSAEQPLMLSLDDIVLTEEPPGHARVTLASHDRLAVFANTFARGTDLSDMGLYRADSDRPYFTSQPQEATARDHLRNYSYIAEYPDWTRLVIAQGNLFDVFDRRTPDSTNGVVGARAAVRWVDATDSGVGASTGTVLSRPGVYPGTSDRVFFAIEPYYEQDHNRGPVGRYDTALLRCCDVQSGNEIAVCLQYFRFYFNFDPTFKAAFDPNTSQPVGSALNADQRRQWINTAIGELHKRWNGPDGSYNPGGMEAAPRTAGALRLRAKVLVFCQHLEDPPTNVPNRRCHFELGVFRHNDADDKVRAYMGSGYGQGALDRQDNRPDTTNDGWFTFAHETGHAFSLDDEYIESSLNCSYRMPGFLSCAPGNPFATDRKSMMQANIEVRIRHLWHVAEWLRRYCLDGAGNTVDWQLVRGDFRYFIRHHSQAQRSHVSYPVNPVAQWRNQSNGGRGRFDAYLYELGRDRDSVGGIRGGKTFQALLVLMVKMRFTFDKNDFDDIHDFLSGAHNGIIRHFRTNLRVQLRNASYQNIWVEVSPRYIVDTYVDENTYYAAVNLSGTTEAARRTEYSNKVSTLASAEPEHFTINVVDRWDVGRGVREWRSPGPASRHLTYEYDDEHQFWELFSQMLGLAEREEPSTSNFAGIAGLIGGQVVSL